MIEAVRLDDIPLALGVELPDPGAYQQATGETFRSYQLSEPE